MYSLSRVGSIPLSCERRFDPSILRKESFEGWSLKLLKLRILLMLFGFLGSWEATLAVDPGSMLMFPILSVSSSVLSCSAFLERSANDRSEGTGLGKEFFTGGPPCAGWSR